MNKFLLSFILFSSLASAEVLHPKSVQEMKQTSVRITNLEMTSGGTGSIFKSFSNATHILTNKHICRLIEPGGIVEHKGKTYLITHYKKFPQHDLCIVRIAVGLGIDTEIAPEISNPSESSWVSGHPSLLPHIVTKGHLSEHQDIQLITGLRKCTQEDLTNDPTTCLYFGGMPIVQTFDSQLISNLIKPGNSGSAVYNYEGFLIGVVFAGSGRDFSFGYIVPQIYLYYFLQNADKFAWVEVGTPVEEGDMIERTFNYEKCVDVKYKGKKYNKIKDFCKQIQDNMIWRK